MVAASSSVKSLLDQFNCAWVMLSLISFSSLAFDFGGDTVVGGGGAFGSR
jgi:hypothetical protein